MNCLNTKLTGDIRIASEQEKRIRNALSMHASVFLKEHKLIDYNVYSLFKVYNKKTKQTYTIEIEKEIENTDENMIWAECDCPDFQFRITEKAWNIPCKHIYKVLYSLKNNTYIDLVNREVSMVSEKTTLKIDYLDNIECPECGSEAVVHYEEIACIFCKEHNAKYVCESCYHVW